jgi:hypothetical protein
MALALLREMGRKDAAPLFVEATHAEDFAARWSAMRDLVALAPATAQPRLAGMAAHDPHPEVRAAAATTLALLTPLPPAGGVGGGAVVLGPHRQAPPKPSPEGEGFKDMPCPA